MRTIAFIGVIASSALVIAQEASSRKDYASEASYIVGTSSPEPGHHSPAEMARAANKFLASLYDQQRGRVAHALRSPERRAWTNVPPRPDSGGLRLGDCSAAQVKAFCNLLATLLSEQGYAKMCSIMLADDQLLRGGQARPGFGTENFSVVLFGSPSATAPWAFQLDGHHVAVNLAIHGDKLAMSPSFIGTQPEAFHIAAKKYRPLAHEIDVAFQLVNSLSDEQTAHAVVDAKRGNLVTGPGNDSKVPEPRGVSCGSFNDAQRKRLLVLVSQWVNDLPPKQAERRMKQVESELDTMHFAWKGSLETGSDVSYAIQGPSLIIEYACQDLGGDPLNHIHTMYRDPTNEYGKQLDGP